MSEPHILVPLSLFGDAENLTPQGLKDALSKTNSDKVSQLEAVNAGLIAAMKGFVSGVELILDEDTAPFNKFVKLRESVREMKGFVNHV